MPLYLGVSGMKRLIFISILFCLIVYKPVYPQSKIQDAKRYLSKAKRAYKAGNILSVKRNLKKAYRYDSNNPEIVYLISAFFFNQETDVDQANKLFRKFQEIMRGLSENGGGAYKEEYDYLKNLIDTPPDANEENPLIKKALLENIWRRIETDTPESRCKEGIKSAKTAINLNQLQEALRTLGKIENDCGKSNQQLNGTTKLLKAQIAFKNGEFLHAANQLSLTKEVLPLFVKEKQELVEDVGRELQNTFTNDLNTIKNYMNQHDWDDAQRSLNRLIPYLSFIPSQFKADFHYKYAQVYLNLNKYDKAREEALKAEQLGYSPDEIGRILSLVKNKISGSVKEKEIVIEKNNAFTKLLNDAQIKFSSKNYKATKDILTSVQNVSTQDKKDQKKYYLLLCKTYIATKQFKKADDALQKLKDLGYNKAYAKEFDHWVGEFIKHWDENLYRINDNEIQTLEALAKKSEIKKGFRGRLYYVLAKINQQKDAVKFSYYFELAKKENYDPIRLASLKKQQKSEIPVENIFLVKQKDQGGKNIGFILSSSKLVPYKLYRTKREYLGAQDKPIGRIIETRTNEVITLQTGNHYAIEFKNQGEINKRIIYESVLITSIIALFLYIR